MDELAVGREFSDFHRLSAAIENFEQTNFVQFYKRDSRRIEADVRRNTRKTYKTAIEYANITYACVHGGRAYKTDSKGMRPHQSSFKKACPAQIKIIATKDGQRLVVKENNMDHTHPVNETSFKHLPRQRRMNAVEREAVEGMLRMRPNKKILQAELVKDTGKYVILKDIHNIQTKISPKSDADSLLAEMRKVPGATVEVLVTANVIQGIFFQTKEMQLAFSEFPEVLMVDATYKLNDIRMPLYVLMVIDGNGESEIAALWIVQTEDRETVDTMTTKFKEHNPAWDHVHVIMADKDMVERDVFRTQLPDAALMICLFHTLRTFKREIATDKMGITAAQRDVCREMVTKLTYARCEAEYQELYTTFQEAAPQQVLDYYNKQWHNIRAEWVEGLKSLAILSVPAYPPANHQPLEIAADGSPSSDATVERPVRQKQAPQRFRRSFITSVVSAKSSANENSSSSTTGWLVDSAEHMELPRKVLKRGRPKGAEQTVIGLPAKRKCFAKPVAFCKKDPLKKNKIILGWLVGNRENTALTGTLMEENDVEVRPECLPAKITDPSIDVYRVRKYFTSEAWLLVEDVMKQKAANPQWICPICAKDADGSVDDGHTSLACDCCLDWYHLACLGKKSRPKSRTWICGSCHTAAHVHRM